MQVNIYSGLLLLSSTLFFGCESELKTLGDQREFIFENAPVFFDPEINKEPDENNIIRLDAGRTLIKKINFPKFEKAVTATLRVRVLSNGDPWDKIGSVFLLPSNSIPGFIEADKEGSLFPSHDYPGMTAQEKYMPAIELMRFATSFGIGYYSDSLPERRPVYMEEWAKEIIWEEDITAFMSELEGEHWIGIHVDTWTKQGYLADVEIQIEESKIEEHEAVHGTVIPILNSVHYISTQKTYDRFDKEKLSVKFDVPENSTAQTLRYIITGHGGHEGGDEFVKQEQIISVDGKELYKFTPWRPDCDAMRRFNPHAGVWTEEIEWRGETLKERVASSDLPRSGWCPADKVSPIDIHLSLDEGAHTLEIEIPGAQAMEENKHNFWIVSAVLIEN
ncbi:MAG: hypothetical protein ACI959_000267 [Limisphaerales bacterium]|jgi:hypothetical protein